jgi:Helix-hairpin-helix motif
MKQIILIILLIATTYSYAQDFPRKDLNLEKLVDEIFPIQDLDLNYEDLYENLAQLMSNPLELNSITREQLRSLFVITEEEINAFIKYRENHGPLLSVYELQSIPEWTRSTFDDIIPFVTIHEAQTKLNASILKRISEEKNNYLVLRYERSLEDKKGYLNPDSTQRYAGSPDKLYMRYRVARSNDFSLGFTAEKDPGEAMQWAPSKKYYGFDFISFHAQVLNKGRLKNLIVGDYQSQFGQGLVLGSVFGFGKNSETITSLRRSNLGFLPYSSVGENLFYRGIAASYELSKNFVIHSFASLNNKDGTINQSTEDDGSISSFINSGLHRTPSEIQRRQQIKEAGIGTVLQFRNQYMDAGVIFHQVNFGQPFLRTAFPYNQFAFNGIQNKNASAYMNFSWANFTFFGEAAQTIGYGNAFTAGLLGNITHQLEVSLLFRDFSKNFYSFYSNAFAENSTPQNEQGFYWGWKFRFNKKYSASGYMDLFQFPWLRYRGYSPSEGSEWLLRFNYSPSKTVQLFLQVREESKVRNLGDETTLYTPLIGVKRNYWINCDYAASPNLSFKTRVQFSTYDLASITTRGIAIVQDMNFSINQWSFGLRYAVFDTDDYDNRLYVYERNVWLAYSFPAYYGVGIRNYVLVQYKLSKMIDIWLRWGHIRYVDRAEIGSGTETITGNSENDVKFQVRMRF